MYYLASAFPQITKIKIPFTRDQAVLFMIAVNEIILGVDIFLAHSISGSIVPYEWIPIIFGPAAGVLLLIAGAISLKKRSVAVWISTVVFLLSIVVGVLGSYFHLRRGLLLDAPLLEMLRFDVVVWAPPMFGPITFAGLGIFGLFASLIEDPVDSGKLKLWGKKTLQMPISKTNMYLLLVSLGILAMVFSGVLDHSRTGFTNPWLWVPTVVGVFAVVVTAVMGIILKPTKTDVMTIVVTMVLMIVVGLVGAGLHIQQDLTTNMEIVQERFLRGAPFMAPLNYANMGLIALLLLLDPREEKVEE
jgi:hypothetical protein